MSPTDSRQPGLRQKEGGMTDFIEVEGLYTALAGATVTAWDGSDVTARAGSNVTALDGANVVALDGATVTYR
jgi:hypothetical protein